MAQPNVHLTMGQDADNSVGRKCQVINAKIR
jgi:hypothetical protein